MINSSSEAEHPISSLLCRVWVCSDRLHLPVSFCASQGMVRAVTSSRVRKCVPRSIRDLNEALQKEDKEVGRRTHEQVGVDPIKQTTVAGQ
jgi:hypothetical protein